MKWEEWWSTPDEEGGRSYQDMYESGDIDDHRTWIGIVMEAFDAGQQSIEGGEDVAVEVEKKDPANRLKRIAEIIEGVDNRCFAADGSVTPTNGEITSAEMIEIYQLAIRS